MDAGRERLTEELNQRRRALKLRWNAVAVRLEMSVQNLLRIRQGDISISEDAEDAIERFLRWETGSVQAVLAGGEPTPLKVDVSYPAAEFELQAVRHEFSADARQRILEMTIFEIIDFVRDMATQSSPRAAEAWLRAAMVLRAEVSALADEPA